MTSTRRLAGQHALVTGAASGIGRGVARAFADHGAAVWFVDKSLTALVEATDGVASATSVRCDVSDPARIEQAIAAVPDRLDVVVVNAAVQLVGRDAPLAGLDDDTWHETVAVNLTGAMVTLRAAVRRMLAQDAIDGARGSIIVTGSPTGVSGEGSDFAAYAATKAGVHGLARSTAKQYAADGIRVNTVIPGHTLTPLTERLRADPGFAAAVDARIPLGRPGTVDDLAGAYVYLAGVESRYTTGATITVDGGMLL